MEDIQLNRLEESDNKNINSMNNIIALYLPQYHPTEDNNEWWGEGFTEWTNVAKAKKLFPGHYQPKVPADLGFYDLRLPQVRAKQAEMAKECGVSAFCYYHYWFGDGKQELELPFNEVVKCGEPDFPFCLCWANESWSKKFWNKDGSVAAGTKTLIEQKYLGAEDDALHFNSLLQAFKDKRYYRIKGKLVFMIYRPFAFDDVEGFIQRWNTMAENENLPHFFFIAFSSAVEKEYNALKDKGFDAVFSCRFAETPFNTTWFSKALRKLVSSVFRVPRMYRYSRLIKHSLGEYEKKNDVYPMIIPNWDHTPRSGVNGYLHVGTNPDLFEKHVEYVLNHIKEKPEDDKICILKSWNEWGEGNYMEPDLKFGRGYMEALKKAKNKF